MSSSRVSNSRLWVLAGLIFTSLFFVRFTYAQTDNSLESLTNKLKVINTFSASFIQYSLNQSGSRMQESKGDLKAMRGGRFYWHTYEPLEQIVSSNGAEVTVYDPDLEQATIQKVGDQVSATPAILFSGEVDKIGENFNVELDKVEKFDIYTLRPKGDQGLFDKLKVKFIGDNLTALTFTDALGQQSTMSFIQTQINPELALSDFDIKLPEDVDVIRENLPQ